MRKLIALLLSFVCLFSLASCNGNSQNAENTKESSATTNTSEDPGYVSYSLPLTDKEATCKIWSPEWFGFCANYFEGLGDTVFWKEFSEMTGIDFEFTTVSSNAADSLAIALVSGESYDLFMSLALIYSGGAEQAYLDDYIYDINEYLDQVPNYKQVITSDDSLKKKVSTDEGNILGFYRLYQNAYPGIGLYIRNDWLQELGFDVPRTIDEYHDALYAMSVNYDTNGPLWIGYTGTFSNGAFGSAYGTLSHFDPAQSTTYTSMLYQEDGTVRFAPMEDGFRDYLRLMSDWWNEGLLYKDYAIGSDLMGADDADLAAGVALTSYNLAQRAQLPVYGGGEWVPASTPVLELGDTTHLLDVKDAIDSRGIFVSKTCSNLDLILKLCDYLYSPEGQITANYGIDGYTLSYNSNGDPVLASDLLYNNPDIPNSMAARINYLGNQDSLSIYNYDLELEASSDEVRNIIEVWETDTDNANVIPAGVSLTSEESDAFTQIRGDLFTYISEMISKFITGEKSVESDYDEFLNAINQLGAQKVVDLYQAAYDRYMAR